jgi:hypothetical protein
MEIGTDEDITEVHKVASNPGHDFLCVGLHPRGL